MKNLIFRGAIFSLVGLSLMAFLVDTPKVFLIGDSISIQYGPYLERFLGGSVQFDRKKDNGGSTDERVPDAPNGGDSRMVLAYLASKLKEPGFKPDVLVLNCGLHDIKKDAKTGKHQIKIEEYERNLKTILKLLKKKDIPLIWIRTTQVVDSIHNARDGREFSRHAIDQRAYNNVADRIFADAHVPVLDLYTFTTKLSDERFIDHVHYNEITRNLQGAYVAGWINAWFQRGRRNN